MAHPYYPPGIVIDNYRPNETPLLVLLGAFGALLGLVLMTARFLAWAVCSGFRVAPVSDQLLFLWFVLCGSLHCFFEGYFVLNHTTLAGSQSLPAQLWKEYALSDSRYLTSDPFMLCVESVTMVAWGPLCWAVAVAIARGNKSTRYPLQMLASVAHLYGVTLYYGTVGLETALHSETYFRPELVYFWVYFLGMNAPWVVVPALALRESFLEIRRAFAALERRDGRDGRDGRDERKRLQ